MNRDTNPTTASATNAPKTLQEISNEIEQLAAALGTEPSENARSNRFVQLHNGKPIWRFALPFPTRQWAGEYAMSRSGMLYVCEPISPDFDVHRWVICSDAMRRSLSQQPHTIGLGMMDPEMIAEHILDVVNDWLSCNFSGSECAAALKILERALRPKLTEWVEIKPESQYLDSAAEVHACIARFNRVAELMLQSIRSTDAHPDFGGSLIIIHCGIRQAMALAAVLLESAAALCSDADKSPPEGNAPASSFLT